MKLEVKSLNLAAGRPVAILHPHAAKLLNVHVDERIVIQNKENRQVISVVDTALLSKEHEIVLSEEILNLLNLKENDEVYVMPARRPVAAMYIKKKLDGCKLCRKEINEIIKSIVDNKLTEAEIAYFVAAMYKEGMSLEETIDLTESIVQYGKKLNLNSKIIADKHGIGGAAGNRTTPIVTSICAAAGLIMPKTSSRAITSAGGTADVIETIAKVEFTAEEMRDIISKTGACLIWGGALGLAPADDKIIQVERLLHLDPQSQLIASILAKKLSVGATHIILDIPYDKNAKVSKKEALELEEKFQKVAKHFNIKIKTLPIKVEEPIGNGIGPSLEMFDVISVLQQKENRPLDLEKRSIFLAAQLLELTGKAKKGKGEKLAREILQSKKAYDKFLQIIKAQDGDINRLKIAKLKIDFFSKKAGTIIGINGKDLMSIARTAGAPSDKSAGTYIYKHLKSKVQKGEKILTLYAENSEKMKNAEELYLALQPIKIK